MRLEKLKIRYITDQPFRQTVDDLRDKLGDSHGVLDLNDTHDLDVLDLARSLAEEVRVARKQARLEEDAGLKKLVAAKSLPPARVRKPAVKGKAKK